MRLFWNARAERDLIEAADYIAQDNPAAAKRWIETIRRRVKQAQAFPESGRPVPAWDANNWRELVEGNYLIVYQIHEDAIEVMTVFESHRLRPRDIGPDEDR